MTISDRVRAFRQLHQSGCFLMPNPWDMGSARYLARLGFPALATTSAGFAWSIGRADNHITLEDALAHMQTIAAGVSVPVNADFEGGFAIEPDDVARNVSRAAVTGVAGLSIEDSTGDPAHPLFEHALAVARIKAARRAIDGSGTGVLLTARSEGFIVGRPDLDETLRRLAAYADAGADCLYAPGIRNSNEIAAVVSAVAPKPVNVLASGGFATATGLAAMGVRRISVGGALARTAWRGFMHAAREIAEHGTFAALDRAVASSELNEAFREQFTTTRRATGTFDVKLVPQSTGDKADETVLGRMSIDKQYYGDLAGTAAGEMLTALTRVQGSAGYVAVERVAGTLGGRSGTFALQHNGVMTRGVPSLSVIVVPDSATGELSGLTGRMNIIIEGRKHSYVLEYTLPATQSK